MNLSKYFNNINQKFKHLKINQEHTREYARYQDVPQQYCWDLESVLGEKTIGELIKKVLDLYKQLITIKDSKYKSASNYLNALKQEDELMILMNKVHNYIYNRLSQNVVDPEITNLSEKFNYDLYLLQQELGSEESRFFKNSKKIEKWLKNDDFALYRHQIENHLRSKNHQLSQTIEEFRLQEERADISASEIFQILTNSELYYGFAKNKKGQTIKVTESNRSVLAKHPDFDVRKSSLLAYRQAYLNHKGTLANLLYQHFKHAATWSKIKKYSSTIEGLTFCDNVDKSLLKTLYENVQKYLPLFKKVRKYHGIFYEKKFKTKMTKYDLERELVKVNAHYSVEQAQSFVLESIKPFGQQYFNIVKKALLEECWVDYMPVQNKRKGAYSIGGTYDIDKKFILMNFDGTLRSVETLAHEMGHSMHSYYSDLNQSVRNSQYPIFLAEIASIFNELMLFEHMLSTTNNEEMQFYIYQKMIFGFMATVLRQTEWSNYEYDLYNLIDQGQPMSTYESLAKLYYQNSKKYQVSKPEKFRLENQFPAVYVPHFYYNFYVYKYAIGQICANIFYRKYQLEGKEALQTYIKQFLSAGGHDYPLQILKSSGIDLHDPLTYKLGFEVLEKNIQTWIKLGKKIFKIK